MAIVFPADRDMVMNVAKTHAISSANTILVSTR